MMCHLSSMTTKRDLPMESNIKILVFNDENQKINQKIDHALTMVENKYQLILTRDYLTFKEAFSFCFSGETVIVFFVSSETDMAFLESMQSKFVDIKLIVNQPEQNSCFESRIVKLFPRAITDSHDCDALIPGMIVGMVKEKIRHRL